LKGEYILKEKIKNKFRKVIEFELRSNANSTTCSNIYQPKAPVSLEKFKKHID
jgi:cyclic lactone autoinducer peptide